MMEAGEMKEKPEHDDDDIMLDHVALECMNAIEKKDKTAFREAFSVLVTEILHDLSDEMEMGEKE